MLPQFGLPEFLLIAVVALIVVGPKDLPLMMRKLGQWIGQAKRMAGEFQNAFDDMARQAELDELRKEINDLIASTVGAIAKLDKIQFVSGLPKTRSGKIMRRILRKIASRDTENLGDISTLLNPDIVEEIKSGAL